MSQKIVQLEARLGVPLLIRTTRNVVPTAASRLLADRLLPVLAETRAALQDAASAQQDVRGLLRLNVTGAVMVDILPPLLDRFLVTYPGVRVELVVEDRLVDIAAAGCDAGIRYGEHLAQDMIAVAIGPAVQRLALAAAPSYLAARDVPLHPRDLLGPECLRRCAPSSTSLQQNAPVQPKRIEFAPLHPSRTSRLDPRDVVVTEGGIHGRY